MNTRTQDDVFRHLPASGRLDSRYTREQWANAIEEAFKIPEPTIFGTLVAVQAPGRDFPFMFMYWFTEGDPWHYLGREFSASPLSTVHYAWESLSRFGEVTVLTPVVTELDAGHENPHFGMNGECVCQRPCCGSGECICTSGCRGTSSVHMRCI